MARELDPAAAHAAALAAGDGARAASLRSHARKRARRAGVPVPSWAEWRGRGPAPERRAPAPERPAPGGPVELPDWARRWRASAGTGACARASERGVELSYFDARSGERLMCFVPAAKFNTDNAAAYALAQGVLVFSPARPRHDAVRGSFMPGKGKAPSPRREDPALSSGL